MMCLFSSIGKQSLLVGMARAYFLFDKLKSNMILQVYSNDD